MGLLPCLYKFISISTYSVVPVVRRLLGIIYGDIYNTPPDHCFINKGCKKADVELVNEDSVAES